MRIPSAVAKGAIVAASSRRSRARSSFGSVRDRGGDHPAIARTLLVSLDLSYQPATFAPARDPPQVELGTRCSILSHALARLAQAKPRLNVLRASVSRYDRLKTALVCYGRAMSPCGVLSIGTHPRGRGI